MEYCIAYLSSSTGLLSPNELARILNQSQKNNRALGITGILLYFNGNIIQVLEGEEESVNNLYEVIRQDARHTHVVQLYRKPIARRSFPDWLMGYKALSAIELNHLTRSLPFLQDPSEPIPKEDNVILSLVQLFYQTNYRN
ncbi:BLUF domain-containing protein [Spirosoma aerophilum]